MKHYYEDPNDGDELAINPSLLSTCCGAVSVGEITDDNHGHYIGMCSKCKDYTTFEQVADEE